LLRCKPNPAFPLQKADRNAGPDAKSGQWRSTPTQHVSATIWSFFRQKSLNLQD